MKGQLIGKSNLEKNRNKKRSSKRKRPTSGSLRKSNKKDKKQISWLSKEKEKSSS